MSGTGCTLEFAHAGPLCQLERLLRLLMQLDASADSAHTTPSGFRVLWVAPLLHPLTGFMNALFGSLHLRATRKSSKCTEIHRPMTANSCLCQLDKPTLLLLLILLEGQLLRRWANTGLPSLQHSVMNCQSLQQSKHSTHALTCIDSALLPGT